MKSNELYDSTSVAVLLEAQDLAHTDTATAWIDTQGYNSVEILVTVGALTGVDGDNYLTPVLQHSDTTAASAAAAVDSADIYGAFTKIDATSEDSTVQRVGYCGSKRYVRVNLDYTGTGISAGIVGVLAVVGHAKSEPAAAPTVAAAT
jgi:hypothetical protein